MAEIIDGKKISQEIKDEVRDKVAILKEDGIEVTLAVILVGNDPASGVYVNNKKKAVISDSLLLNELFDSNYL